MFPAFQLTHLLFYLPALFLCMFIFRYIVNPYRSLQFYKNQEGIAHFFFPVLGIFKVWKEDFKNMDDVLGRVKTFRKDFKEEKAWVTNVGTKTVLSLRDTRYIKEFLLKQTAYKKDGVTHFLRPLIGSGLVTAEGETWKRHRRIISNSFHYESLKDNVKTVQDTTKELLAKIPKEEYNEFSAIRRIQEITGEVVGRIFFGENLNNYTLYGKPLTIVLADLVADITVAAISPLSILLGPSAIKHPILPKYKKLVKRIEEFRGTCLKIIQDRKSGDLSGHDLLASLLATQKSEDPEQRLSDIEILDEFLTFFVAGMDTTGHLVGMALYNLTQNPEYFSKLKQERDSAYTKQPIVNADIVQEMEELHCFLRETLRFHSPAPMTFVRLALSDHEILDLKIKKGTWIKPDFFTLFFDEKFFNDPWKFNPERWKENKNKLDPYAFTPFSAGPRNCIGQHLAIMEAKIIISEFLEKFDIKLRDGYKPRMIFRFLYEPEEDVPLRLTPRAVKA